MFNTAILSSYSPSSPSSSFPTPTRGEYLRGSDYSQQHHHLRTANDDQDSPTLSHNLHRIYHRPRPISQRTASAILYTLEEAIRTPYPFTPDLEEENASLSAMMAAAAPGPVPVPQYPNTTGNPAPQPSTRHARQQSTSSVRIVPAESSSSGRRESSRASRNAPPPMQQHQPSGGAGIGLGVTGVGTTAGGRLRSDGEPEPLNVQHRVHAPATGARPTTSRGIPSVAGPSAGASGPSQQRQPSVGPSPGRPTTRHQPEAQSVPRSQPHVPPIQTNTHAGPSTARSAPNVGGGATAQTQPQPQRQQTHQSASSSFPHAFERWETLSSRWEGLTGYWISRLEENRNELAHLPLEQQMSRQITDLSAAGANLFHAVVELQRLRASSERKFQRWFFETRADQERAREMSSELERNLRTERQQRADAVTSIQRLEKEKATAEKLVEEMRRELQISKEECRRAWEELGRREQEERERSNSLREGYPTYLNGVQVFPFNATPSRSGSLNRPRTASSSQAPPPPTQMAENETHQEQTTPKQQESFTPGTSHQEATQRSTAAVANTSAVPGTSTSSSQANAQTKAPQNQPQQQQQQQQQQQPPSNNPFYQHEHSNIHPPQQSTDPGTLSPGEESGSFASNSRHSSAASQPIAHEDDDDYEDEEVWQLDEQGHLRIDENGNPILVRPNPEGQQWGVGGWSAYPSYDGAAYGSGGGGVGIGGYASGWESVPRHHHPTRLSDVLEEEERTQTSVSDGRRSR
ncbi:hypothetical protein RUND412_001656 [Rhizina undulata]